MSIVYCIEYKKADDTQHWWTLAHNDGKPMIWLSRANAEHWLGRNRLTGIASKDIRIVPYTSR